MNDEEIQMLAKDTAKKHINNLADQLKTGDFNFNPQVVDEETKKAQDQERKRKVEEVGDILAKSSTFLCDMCKGCLFNLIYIVKQVPASISPNGKLTAVPVQVFRCAECNYISDDMLPNKLITDINIDEIVNRQYKPNQ